MAMLTSSWHTQMVKPLSNPLGGRRRGFVMFLVSGHADGAAATFPEGTKSLKKIGFWHKIWNLQNCAYKKMCINKSRKLASINQCTNSHIPPPPPLYNSHQRGKTVCSPSGGVDTGGGGFEGGRYQPPPRKINRIIGSSKMTFWIF